MLPAIKSANREELEMLCAEWRQAPYRVDQILDWLYRKQVGDWSDMSNLPKGLRERLQQHYALRSLELVRWQGARDSTVKFLWRLHDGSLVESVLIPANPALYGESSDRRTLCVSTQVGCAYGCRFCASGLEGWKRNLAPDEIVDQVLAAERWGKAGEVFGTGLTDRPAPSRAADMGASGRVVDNLVIMGMGEPLANYDHLLKALEIVNASWGVGIGARKITISTSGLAPQIKRLADEAPQYGLAISLHGATDEVRGRLMPVNRKHPLAELLEAGEYYLEQKGRLITLEYILIAGLNDGLDQVPGLSSIARRLRAKINLIPYNQVEGLPWARPSEAVCEAFCAALTARRVPVTLRREKGHDIEAACGQLRLRAERERRNGLGAPIISQVKKNAQTGEKFVDNTSPLW